MSWSDIQWGSVGEWVSGLGALAVVGTAFVIQHREHTRQGRRDEAQRIEQERRDQRRLSEQRDREHRLALRDVIEHVRFRPDVKTSGGRHEYCVKYDNTGPQPVHVTRLLVKLGPGVTLVDSPSRYVLVPRHQDRMLMGWQSIGDDATNDTLSVEAEFEDHLGFSFHCDGEGRITAAIQPE